MNQQQRVGVPGFRSGEARASVVLFSVIFAIFLVIALVAQLLTLNWRLWLPGSEGNASFFNSVRSSVYTVMSYIS